MTSDTVAPVERVLIIGYGAMGSGIALSFARAGFATTVLSRDPERHGALPHGMTATAELPAEAPDLIIESVPEEIDTKIATFQRLEEAYGTGPEGPILATNTSGLPLDEIAAHLTAKERFLAAHYMQPADTMPMLEVAKIEETRDDVLTRTIDALERTGREVIVLKKPVTGFLINRLQHAILHEAYYLIEEGVVTVEDVDRVARSLFGPRLCITGLIKQKDLSGLDVHALAQRSIVPALHHGAEPAKMLQEKYAAGDLGAKSGRGFYDWRDQDVDAVRRDAKKKLEDLLAYLADG
jgi:3-hydroxybutyryl-CoA dehydrogenase